jgi:hypothetical protein
MCIEPNCLSCGEEARVMRVEATTQLSKTAAMGRLCASCMGYIDIFTRYYD